MGAGLFGVFTLLFALPSIIRFYQFRNADHSMVAFGPEHNDFMFSGWVFASPVLYALIGFCAAATYAALFNVVAPRIGGFPVEIAES
jgi:hypothetical protein